MPPLHITQVVLIKKTKQNNSRLFHCLPLFNQFHLQLVALRTTPPTSPSSTPPDRLSPSHLPLCVAASSEQRLILPLSAAPRQKRGERGGTAILSLLPPLWRSSALLCAYSRSSKLPFSSLFICFSFFLLFGFPSFFPFFSFFFFLAGGALLALTPHQLFHPRPWRTSQTPFPCEFQDSPPSPFPSCLYCFVSVPKIPRPPFFSSLLVSVSYPAFLPRVRLNSGGFGGV